MPASHILSYQLITDKTTHRHDTHWLVFCSCGYEMSTQYREEVSRLIEEHRIDAICQLIGLEFDMTELDPREIKDA